MPLAHAGGLGRRASSTIAATMAALATTRTRPYPGLTFKYAFINQPLMVPEIVTGVALLIVFSRIKVWTGYSGLGYLIVAHTAFCIPFAYLPIRARLESMDLTLERAAADLYATPWKAFRRVTLPLLEARHHRRASCSPSSFRSTMSSSPNSSSPAARIRCRPTCSARSRREMTPGDQCDRHGIPGAVVVLVTVVLSSSIARKP